MLAHGTVSDGYAAISKSGFNGSILTTENQTENELRQKFAPKHIGSELLAGSLSRLGYASRAGRAMTCGTLLSFGYAVADDGSVSQNGKLHQANFCKERLCPMCSWRRSRKIFGQVSKIMDAIKGQYKFLFLTLTVPNCPADSLGETIDEMMQAWSRLIRRKEFKSVVKGFYRVLEITRNPITGEYHPHFHIVLAVSTRYGKEQYISHDQWLNMWRQAMKDERITQVDIRRAHNKRGDDADMSTAIAEIAKYAVKSSDYLHADNSELTDRIVSELLPVLHHRRLCHFGGVFAKVHEALHLDNPEDGDLIDGDINPELTYMIIHYGWSAGYYKMIGTEIMRKKE